MLSSAERWRSGSSSLASRRQRHRSVGQGGACNGAGGLAKHLRRGTCPLSQRTSDCFAKYFLTNDSSSDAASNDGAAGKDDRGCSGGCSDGDFVSLLLDGLHGSSGAGSSSVSNGCSPRMGARRRR